MQSLNYYYQTISGIYTPTDTEKNQISQMVCEHTYELNTHLLRVGQVSDSIHFISRGLVRTYYTDPSTCEEFTTWLMAEGSFIYSVKSYMSGEPSTESIVAVEPTTTLSIKKSDWQKLLGLSMGMSHLALYLMEQYLYICDERLRMLKYPAQDRYLYFTTNHKDIAARIKPQYLASYLGISRSTLFEFRKKRI